MIIKQGKVMKFSLLPIDKKMKHLSKEQFIYIVNLKCNEDIFLLLHTMRLIYDGLSLWSEILELVFRTCHDPSWIPNINIAFYRTVTMWERKNEEL